MPALGVVSAVRIFIVVDLPAPLGPSSPRTSPGITLRDTFFTATSVLFADLVERWNSLLRL